MAVEAGKRGGPFGRRQPYRDGLAGTWCDPRAEIASVRAKRICSPNDSGGPHAGRTGHEVPARQHGTLRYIGREPTQSRLFKHFLLEVSPLDDILDRRDGADEGDYGVNILVRHILEERERHRR